MPRYQKGRNDRIWCTKVGGKNEEGRIKGGSRFSAREPGIMMATVIFFKKEVCGEQEITWFKKKN